MTHLNWDLSCHVATKKPRLKQKRGFEAQIVRSHLWRDRNFSIQNISKLKAFSHNCCLLLNIILGYSDRPQRSWKDPSQLQKTHLYLLANALFDYRLDQEFPERLPHSHKEHFG